MPNAPFIEAHSGHPFVEELSRRAVRILNDPSLDRTQRELHIRRLQGLLRDREVSQTRANVAKEAKSPRRNEARSPGGPVVANPSQVVARHKEFRLSPSVPQTLSNLGTADSCAVRMPVPPVAQVQRLQSLRPLLMLKKSREKDGNGE